MFYVDAFRLFLFVFGLPTIFASPEYSQCLGYNITVKYFRNCEGPAGQGIVIHNLTFIVEDCKVIPRGCFSITNEIPPGKVSYSLSKPPFKKKGIEDICKFLESDKVQEDLENYGKSIPRKCKINPGLYCITTGYTSINYISDQTFIKATGETAGYFKMDGTCLDFKVEITKNSNVTLPSSTNHPILYGNPDIKAL